MFGPEEKSNLGSTLNVSPFFSALSFKVLLSLCTPPAFSPPRALSPLQIFQGAGLLHGEVFCWVSLSVELQLTIGLRGQHPLSPDHPACSCCHSDPQAGQETGNRKKKAGHPVHLDRRVCRDITQRSAINREKANQGLNILLLSPRGSFCSPFFYF